MIYAQAVIQVLISMGPHYISSTYTWMKCALWDAPYRFILDVQLEKISIEREQHLSGHGSDKISNND
jgi:hypothetical protein|tara:strand:+ start:347 stop:547 length:201 start_codon:yes stop_codon:yes gene_type:complete